MIDRNDLRAWGNALVAEGDIFEYGGAILALLDELDAKDARIETLREALKCDKCHAHPGGQDIITGRITFHKWLLAHPCGPTDADD